ncbi:polysaccharide pyruvyl transferase family protein [Litorivivens sp.]|uniref:polysaccharide pyruvyl transferase family protein n=2 Tax=Litorivivens sp. TaxID=2020868 RepID=UPI003562CF0E
MPKTFDALLVGYYGMHNTGDDMLMAATAEGAKALYGASRLAATCPKGSEVAQWLECAPVQSRKQRVRAQDRALKYVGAWRSEHILIGGGSVFHTAKDIAQKRHYLKLSGNAEHRAVGVGLGPFVDTEAEKQCAAFLNEAAFTGVRDRDSYDIAKSIAPAANVALTYDLAPGLVESDAFKSALASQRDNAIGFALCPKERFEGYSQRETNRLLKLAAAAKQWHRESGAGIRLFDFNGHPTLGDAQVHQEFMNLLDGVPVEYLPYHANPYHCIAAISRTKMMVAMRLHAAIFSFLTKTPYLSLNYHPKCDNWCRDSQHSPQYAFDSATFDVEALTKSGFDILNGHYLEPQLAIAAARDEALKNWEAL